jgi:DNA glycosylase AlkZ-like
VAPDIVSLGQLNRATLARQLLLERSGLDPVAAVGVVAGLQAQEPASPYVGLWSRLSDFQPTALTTAIADRRLVKGTLMRATLHLVSARDYPSARAALQPTFIGDSGDPRSRTGDSRLDGWQRRALAYLAERPRSNTDMRSFLARAAGEGDGDTGAAAGDAAAGDAAAGDDIWWTLRRRLALIHAPEPVTWSYGRRPLHAHAPAWLPEADFGLSPEAATSQLVRRYLRAFGPASIADASRWAGIARARIRAAVDALASTTPLRRYHDEHGRELLDVEDGAMPSTDTPAPVRFLPMWDNAILGYDDRRRLISDAIRAELVRRNGDALPAILVDGTVRGAWITRPPLEGGGIMVRLFERLSASERQAVEEEAHRLEAWLRPHDPDVFAYYRRWFSGAENT